MYDSYGDGWNGASYTIYAEDGVTELASGELLEGSSGEMQHCLYAGNFSILVGGGGYDSEISFSVEDAFGNVLIATSPANFGSFPPDPMYEFSVTGEGIVYGCTDPSALNYDANAESDNGTCYYTGDYCDIPYTMSVSSDEQGNPYATGTASTSVEQWFSYTAVNTGNITFSSVGLTGHDTYLVVLSSCEIDTSDDEIFYTDILAQNDDVDFEGDVLQSEITLCASAGEEFLIGWIPFYDTGETSFSFRVYETPDIVTPINVNAFAFTQGIQLEWDPIPASCSELENSRSSMNLDSEKKHFKTFQSKDRVAYKLKPGKPLRQSSVENSYLNNSRTINFEVNTPVRRLERDCSDGATEVTFVSVCGGSNCWEEEQSYSVVGPDGLEIISTSENYGFTYTPITICLLDGDYSITLYDSYGDGWNEAVFYAQVDGENIFSFTMGPGDADEGFDPGSVFSGEFTLNSNAVYGCTNPDAANYEPSANTDDGSCYFTGDICEDPIVVSDVYVGITNGAEQFYRFDIPNAPGALTVENSGQFAGSINMYYTCDYETSFPYTGEIFYAYLGVGMIGLLILVPQVLTGMIRQWTLILEQLYFLGAELVIFPLVMRNTLKTFMVVLILIHLIMILMQQKTMEAVNVLVRC